jgi:sugar phosphate isomerase/epimerase
MKSELSNAYGIVQGRLIKSPMNQLQWFPQYQWEKEFELASKVGFSYIEFIAERQHNADNPIWNDYEIEKIKKLAKENELHLYAFCNDFIIDHCLIESTKVIDQTLKLISQGKKLGLEKLILPLFEKSEMSFGNYKSYKDALIELGDVALENNMSICLETILNGEELLEIINDLNHSNIHCVFDTGNRIAFGHDIYSDIILLGDYIKHIHIKDKNENDENVLLGTGKVNFQMVFQCLDEINYNSTYTFETFRGNHPVETAQYNIAFAKFFENENKNF